MKKCLAQMSKRTRIALLGAALVVIAGALLLLKGSGHPGTAVLTVDSVKAASIDSEVIVNVTLNRLGDGLYPAASFVIDFDKARLELLSVDEGSFLLTSEHGEKAPTWSVNVPRSNETGEIRIMYLDLSGGTEAFSGDLTGENGTVFRLRFWVRGSARAGEEYPLTVTDAVFAADDENHSLSMANSTLRVKNGSIEVAK